MKNCSGSWILSLKIQPLFLVLSLVIHWPLKIILDYIRGRQIGW